MDFKEEAAKRDSSWLRRCKPPLRRDNSAGLDGAAPLATDSGVAWS